MERPVPAADEILVKVYASAVNPIDRKIRDGAIVSICSSLENNGVLATVQGFPLSDDITKALAAKNAHGNVVYGENKIEEWLRQIAQLIDEKKVTVSIGKILPLEQVQRAHRESAQRTIRGKFVLEVQKEV
jgi:NADPH:quinone reductase-like Zn-dependent oxidoreductase